MSTRNTVLMAVLLSVLMHLVFLGASFYWQLPGSRVLLEESQRMFNVETVMPEIDRPTRQETLKKFIEKIKFEDPGRGQEKLTKNLLRAEDVDLPVKDLPKPVKKEAIFDMSKSEALNNELSALKQTKEIEQRKVNRETDKEIDVLMAWENFLKDTTGGVEVPEEVLEQMIAFRPAQVSSQKEVLGASLEGTYGSRAREASGLKSDDFEIVDELLGVDLVVYRDPKDGMGYFQISIAPVGGEGSLPALPKEIIFLVDTSLSINAKRLNYFKRGISYSLENLNPQDKFNILSFKEDIDYFSKESMRATPANIEQALRFVGDMRASQRTDLYQAFLDSFKGEAALHPSYFILISDGRPNSGVTNPVRIISEITEINRRKRPIFAYGGGERVNTFLLDYVSFQNRGWAEFAEEERKIDDGFKDFYDKIKNPILTDIRFRISGVDDGAIYPKHLPDFFENTAFVLFGRFKDEKEFSMRIVGSHADLSKELIFNRTFESGRQGGFEIAQKWAMNKLYHLVSQTTLYGYTHETLEEIKQLGEKYDIRTPYRY